MPTSSPSPKRIRDEYRRLLALLATASYGATEAILLAHGFTRELLVELCRGGLASANDERMRIGKRVVSVTRVQITDAGRLALATLKRM